VDKELVREFWDEAACGETLLLPSHDLDGFAAQAAERYRLEPTSSPSRILPDQIISKFWKLG
jgi:hypothetical protein